MYINNQKFYDEICKSRENNKLNAYSYHMVEQIVGLNIRKCYPPSMISKCVTAFAIVESEKHLISFNPDHEAKPNSAFNYFSEVSKRAISKFQLKLK